jgi:hypothetical protein
MARNEGDKKYLQVTRVFQQVSWKKKMKIQKNIREVLVWIGNTSRYLCSKTAEQLPNEITRRRTVGAHPGFHGILVIHY